jgi:hypothetical protein
VDLGCAIRGCRADGQAAQFRVDACVRDTDPHGRRAHLLFREALHGIAPEIVEKRHGHERLPLNIGFDLRQFIRRVAETPELVGQHFASEPAAPRSLQDTIGRDRYGYGFVLHETPFRMQMRALVRRDTNPDGLPVHRRGTYRPLQFRIVGSPDEIAGTNA